ncbi:WbqC family protein [Chryseobacterium sp. HSC-36S06]|uniref:WbqC family protein n=1 Tax=Chryseobacterium sp. HSC-36S06 TaxID=2910970 RepID=UPI00209E2C1A|nr:WbqC family protein [Chryseobacterium sp. HSC-36S06]MCP2037671.1 hypothetical protein [Chryseobacterium sp. HSC-36S06]
MKLAVMQPYIFPYIGYFQMIHTVDVFVFYDDVNYIKQGWINRNRILVNATDVLFTIPLKDASSFKMIKDTEINKDGTGYKKILKTIEQSYKKAPYYETIFPLVENVFNRTHDSIADFAFESIKEVNAYLGISTILERSSSNYAESKRLDRAERLIEICKRTSATEYINAIGGMELYSKEHFASKGIDLKFIKSKPIEYEQFNNNFVPWLSIIDVLMFNSVEEIHDMLNCYELI